MAVLTIKSLYLFNPKEGTAKYVEFLPGKNVLTSSNEDDLVLDCFMGSCSTGIACLETNRNFIGIELDNTYFETCKNRVNTYIKEQNMQDIHIEIA
jgi:site-specific DNA-methyltransferase (adenine-specific)